MYRRIILSITVVCLILVSKSSFADVEAEFKQAEEFKKMGNYQQAEAVLQSIAVYNPGTKEALKAQRYIIYSQLSRGADAQTAIDKLLTDFSEQAGWLPVLYDIAGRCEERKKYDYAKGIYQKITQKYPAGSAQFSEAQVNISKANILPLIDSNNIATAQASVNKLMIDFAGKAVLPDVLYDIGTRYQICRKLENAKVLYQKIEADYPNTKYALRARKALVRLYNDMGKDADAQAAINKLTENFSFSNRQVSQALTDLAKSSETRHKYEQAKNIYQKIISGYPDSNHIGSAQLGIAKFRACSLFDEGKINECLAEVNSIATNFRNEPRLAWILSREIAEQKFYFKAFQLEKRKLGNQAVEYFKKAIVIWEMVANELSDTSEKPYAYNWIADSYYRIGDLKKSAQFSQKVADEYPNFEFAWHNLYMVGKNYEGLLEKGLVDKQTASAKIRQTYQRLLEKYPTCKAVKLAQRWLDKNEDNSRILSDIGNK